MKRHLFPALILCLALAGCGKETAQVVPTPTPTPPQMVETVTPSPETPTEETTAPTPTAPSSKDWKEDPKGYLMDCLDSILEEDEILFRFWIHPGSGPTPETLSRLEFAETIRTLFSELDWHATEAPCYDEETAESAPFNQPGSYGISIYYDGWDGYIHVGMNDPVIMLGDNGPDSAYLRADGSDKLCEKLTDMVPSVYVNLGRVRVPPQESLEATVKLYVEAAMERMEENGHITDYVLRVCEPVAFEAGNWWEEKEEPAWETHPGIAYTVAYSIKPAHPELSYWQNTVDEDGWVSVDWRGDENDYWETIAYDEEDGRYGMY